MTEGTDPALALMLLEADDDVAIRALADVLEASHPAVAEALRAAARVGGDAREAYLAEARARFEAAPDPGVFASLPAALQSEFVSHQRGLLTELERLALSLDGGDVSVLATVRRIVHTLKGDAGIVGLEGMVVRWHGVEEMLRDADADPRSAASRLLEAVSATEEEIARLVAGGPAGVAPPAPAAVDARTPVEAVGDAPSGVPIEVPAAPCTRDEETVAILGEFLAEAADGVAQSDEVLMRAEHGDAEPGDVDTVFRAFHSMKGVAAALEVDPIAHLAHAMEDLLSRCRDGTLPFRGEVVGVLLDGTQLMRVLVDQSRLAVERNLAFAMPARGAEVIAAVRAHTTGGTPAPRVAAAPTGGRTMPVIPPAVPAHATAEAPPPAHVSPPPVAPAPAWLAVPEAPREVAVSGATGSRVASVLARAPSESPPAAPPPVAGDTAASRIRETVKVDLERVDLLVELIGELVIAESMVAGRSEASAAPELRNALRHLTKIVRDLQRMGIGLRMVPLVGVFQKMRRLVRDLCVKVGKEAVLVTHGDGIEMDRSLVEQVADPLVHILRNAMDHGLEAPSERLAAGKPAQGTIVLAASHEAGNIVIEVRDDGRGMNRERILARAVERGLVAPGAELSDAEVFELVFAPGFSTAERVTEVSGRGVGMDVVKRNVEAMGGRVRVTSTAGQGSSVRLTLPLTLAIIDGMLIGCGTERFVVPTRSIVESIRATPQMLVTYAGRHEVVDVRGELHPLVRLHQALDVRPTATNLADGLLLIVDGITRRFAIFVDEVVSRQQVVIKAMDGRLVDTRYYSGACILADGHAGLILNIDALLDSGETREPIGGAA